jgi:hypothetical protein
MYFNYKTTKVVYKRKVKDNGNVSMIEKDDTFNPPDEMMEEGNFEKSKKLLMYGMRVLWLWELILFYSGSYAKIWLDHNLHINMLCLIM